MFITPSLSMEAGGAPMELLYIPNRWMSISPAWTPQLSLPSSHHGPCIMNTFLLASYDTL